MGLIKEPLNVDFSMKSKPWSEKDLIEFRKLMQSIKARNASRKKINEKRSSADKN